MSDAYFDTITIASAVEASGSTTIAIADTRTAARSGSSKASNVATTEATAEPLTPSISLQTGPGADPNELLSTATATPLETTLIQETATIDPTAVPEATATPLVPSILADFTQTAVVDRVTEFEADPLTSDGVRNDTATPSPTTATASVTTGAASDITVLGSVTEATTETRTLVIIGGQITEATATPRRNRRIASFTTVDVTRDTTQMSPRQALRVQYDGQFVPAERPSATASPLDVDPGVTYTGLIAEGLDLQDRFPYVIPFTETTFDETHQYRTIEQSDGTTVPVEQYQIDKAPVTGVESVTAVVDDRRIELTRGTDYTVRDENGDGGLDTIDFGIGGATPDLGTEFEVTYTAIPVITRYVAAFDDEFQDIDIKMEKVIDSHQIDNASGSDLDQIGALFGPIGSRRDREDDEYRAFLNSIVQSFTGRGTVDGIKFAVAAGINSDPDDVTVVEDFSTNTYTLRILNYNAHSTRLIIDLADLADPSGIELDGNIEYEASDGTVSIEPSGVTTV